MYSLFIWSLAYTIATCSAACPSGMKKCSNGRCINFYDTCRCESNEYLCNDGLQCTSTDHRCDGEANCADKSDEADCPSYPFGLSKDMYILTVTMVTFVAVVIVVAIVAGCYGCRRRRLRSKRDATVVVAGGHRNRQNQPFVGYSGTRLHAVNQPQRASPRSSPRPDPHRGPPRHSTRPSSGSEGHRPSPRHQRHSPRPPSSNPDLVPPQPAHAVAPTAPPVSDLERSGGQGPEGDLPPSYNEIVHHSSSTIGNVDTHV